MARIRQIGIILAFATDFLFTLYLALGVGGSTSENTVDRWLDVWLYIGRLLGLIFLSLLAVRVALGRWPYFKVASPPVNDSDERRELSSFHAPQASNVERDQPLLLEGGHTASFQRQVTPDGDERARQIDATVSKQQETLKKLARGLFWRNSLMLFAYLYTSSCSMWTAVLVVSLDVSSVPNLLAAAAHIICIAAMSLEFMLLKQMVADLTAGEPVHMPDVHEHALYWTDNEGKGYAQCSTCNEKVGIKTGGYLTLQCRVCEPSRYGFGGFQMCSQCYRKKAAKSDAAATGASGSGILRGDKGPKVATKLTVSQYIRRLLAMMRGKTLLIMMIAVTGSQLVSAYIPKAQGDCINALVTGEPDKFNMHAIQFAALVLLSAVLSFAMSVSVSIMSSRVNYDMAVLVFKSLINQDIAFYDNAMTGQLTARLNNDLRMAISPISIIINSFVANVIMLLAGFFICLQSSWRLTILAFTFLTPMVHITSEFSKWASKLLMTQYTYMADAQGSATQALTNIKTVRSFAAQEVEWEQYEGHMRKSLNVGITSAWGQGGARFLSSVVEKGASFIVLYYGGHLALAHDSFEVGSIITFTYLWNKLSSSFQGLNENLNAPVKAMSAGQRVFEILDLKPDISEDGGEAFPEELQQVEVQLQEVGFSFQSRPDKKILQGVSLTLAAGQTTAVVGKSGCGKSTISKLLLRFYDPITGSISINTRDLRQMSLPQLRKKVSIVSQDTQLFRKTVIENITYGLRTDEFSMADVERAAKLANAEEFIRTLPEGYKTMIGESGHDLSGGQKQRISIARALVRRPRLLLLDEATSALDAENEAQVQKALDHLMEEMKGSCTIMVIAHRLSTIKDASRIVVLHEGKIIEQGTHEELVHIKDGRYATMIARQLTGGEKEEDEDGAPSDEKIAKDTKQQIITLIEGLPDSKKAEVLMGLMMQFKGAMKGAKGMGR